MFDGLFEGSDNKNVLKLLYLLAHWHGIAKLRVHTESTLAILDANTSLLGKQLRHFKKTICPKYPTKELAREREARKRRQTTVASARASASAAAANVSQMKQLNLSIYKLHALVDYVSSIRRIGSADSYSTQLVCMCL